MQPPGIPIVEPLNLPAQPQQNQGFGQAEPRTGHIGHRHGPASQIQDLFGGLTPMRLGRLADALASLLCYLL